MPKERWANIDDYMNYRPPIPRDKWTRSNEWSFGGPKYDPPPMIFDKKKCPVCGGQGRAWVTKTRRKKTRVKCPAECRYAKSY